MNFTEKQAATDQPRVTFALIVDAYVRANPGATPVQIEKATGLLRTSVNSALVFGVRKRFYRRERVTAPRNLNVGAWAYSRVNVNETIQ